MIAWASSAVTPSRPASRRATELLPAPAGPSIATTTGPVIPSLAADHHQRAAVAERDLELRHRRDRVDGVVRRAVDAADTGEVEGHEDRVRAHPLGQIGDSELLVRLELLMGRRFGPSSRVLRSGAAMGRGVGPLVVARSPGVLAHAVRGTLAIPGRDTTAFRLLRLAGESRVIALNGNMAAPMAATPSPSSAARNCQRSAKACFLICSCWFRLWDGTASLDFVMAP